MNYLLYLHISWMINVILAFTLGLVLGLLYNFTKKTSEKVENERKG